MSMSLLGDYFKQYFREKASPNAQVLEPEKKKEEFVPQFIHAEDVFEDIIPIVESNEFYALSYIGGQGNGKSFSASEFATLAKKAGFLCIYGKAEDILVDLDGWINKVKEKIIEFNDPRLCIVLDDMSYSSNMLSGKKSAGWKHFIADIRHVFENVLGDGIKPKILMIYISHRYHSVPPMLRTSASWIFASMLNEDRYDAQKLIPKNNEERQRLDEIYTFLSDITVLGPKYKVLPLSDNENEGKFTWGTKEEPGDGRLMMIYHSGHMRIFNPRKIQDMLDLEQFRILYVPPVEEEPEKKDMRKEVEARIMTETINRKTLKSQPMREITCKLCGYVMSTRRKEGECIQCTMCHKLIQHYDSAKIIERSKELKEECTAIIPVEAIKMFEKESIFQ